MIWKLFRRIIFLIIIVLLIFDRIGIGQSLEDSNDVRFDAVSTAQGLSQSCVYSIVQDKKGFIWIGTRDGLNRFDGYDFITFKNNPQDTNSLSNNEITSICVNSRGNLWIGTRGGGLNYYDQAINKFTRYSNLNYENIVRGIYENQDGTLWVGTSEGLLHGLFRSDVGKYVFKNVSNSAVYRAAGGNVMASVKRIVSVVSINRISLNELLIGVESGLFIYDELLNQFNRVRLGESDNSIVTSTLLEKSGVLWVGTFNGLVKLTPNKSDSNNYRLTFYNARQSGSHHLHNNRIESIVRDPLGNIWVGTHGGGLVKIETNDRVTTFTNEAFDLQSIGDNMVNSLLMDNTGVLWIGTESQGCNKLDLYRKKFVHIRNIPNKLNSLCDNQVTAITGSGSGAVWVGTATQGLDKLTYNHDGNYRVEHLNSVPVGDNSRVGEVVSVFQDRDNELWIGAASNSITRYRVGKGFRNYITNGYVFSIHQDRAGGIWFGTWGQGLGLLDKNTGVIKQYSNVPENPHSLSSDKVLAIFDDIQGNLWVGTKAGGVNIISLSQLATGKQDFICFKHNQKNQNSLVHNDVYCITQDSRGYIWMGTGGGLSKITWDKSCSFFDAVAKGQFSFDTFLEKDGLPNSVVYGILEDKHGNLWLSTNHGLSKFDPNTKEFKNYAVNDGLQANEFHSNAYFKDDSGHMFFGGVNGLTMFNPEDIKDQPCKPNVVITRLKIFNSVVKPGAAVHGRVILDKDITQAREIELSYKEKEITLDFSALYFANPQRIRYAYRLLGFNDKWQIAEQNNRSATYTNLYNGHYVFQVRATNIEGKWPDAPLELKINILPPFWRKPWFYLVYALIIIVLLIAYRKYSIIAAKEKSRIAIERQEHKKHLEMSEAKMRFFANISHEIRTPLTLISDPLEQVLANGYMDENSRKNLSLISRNVDRLLTMVNQLLQLRNIDMGSIKLNVSEVRLVPFLKEITANFEQSANLRHIRFDFINELNELSLYFDRDMISTVFYNLLSNAFKFTPDHGFVTLKAYEYNGSATQKGFLNIRKWILPKKHVPTWVAIEIADSGSGIPQKEVRNIFHRFYQVNGPGPVQRGGSGIGLALVKEYIELHRGFIRVSSKPGKGSVFTVYLRLGKNHVRHEKSRIDSIVNDDLKLKFPIVDGIKNSSSEIVSSISVNNDHKEGLATLLIVEDDHELSGYLSDYFKRDYNVIQAFNGKVGMELAISLSPDLILSDVMLPEIDGFELCRKLKSTLETSHIPIILLTAKATEENIQEGYELGADLYMAKPFHIKILEKQVKMLIQSRSLLRDKFSKQLLLMPSDVTITSTDERFLKRLIEVTDAHLTDSEFDVMKLVDAMYMSHTVILRKLKALTGMALVDFIKDQRLKKAALILQKGKISIAEVSYMVGFSDPKYFSKCFIKEFGKTPTEYSKGFYSSQQK